MEKIITYDKLRLFAYSNDHLIKGDVRGIAVNFFGLGGAAMFSEDGERGTRLAEKGIIYVVPYYNPWSWMNRQTVDYVDEIVDVLFDRYSLPDECPVISIGDSMGGLASLVYAAYAKRTPAAVVSNCPVCDLPYHFTEREDLPRTLYSAFGSYDCSLEEALESASPIHLVSRLSTETKYYVFHCGADELVNKERHSDRFVEKMKEHHDIVYFEVPGRGHCDLTDEMREKYMECIECSAK